MKKQFKIGDLVWSCFHRDYEGYGLGIIIKTKKHSSDVTAYCIHWANYHPTWESPFWLKLKARTDNV